ncbi:hypothetical protein AB0E01_41700 [Nocardia vinacea]
MVSLADADAGQVGGEHGVGLVLRRFTDADVDNLVWLDSDPGGDAVPDR